MSLIDTGFALHEVRVGSHRMAYVDQGDGPPVVIVHGSPLSSASFREQIAALSPRFRVIAPDQPGFGRSSIPSQGVDFTDQGGGAAWPVRSSCVRFVPSGSARLGWSDRNGWPGVDDERVEVDVQVRGRAEALDRSDGAAAAVGDSAPPSPKPRRRLLRPTRPPGNSGRATNRPGRRPRTPLNQGFDAGAKKRRATRSVKFAMKLPR
jgi:hypothetical protein